MTRASSMRAQPVSKGAPLSLNRSTASSRCFRACLGLRDRAAMSPAARLARARRGPVPASFEIARSSSTACAASSVRSCSKKARTINSSAAARSVRFFSGRRRRCRSARSAPALKSPRSNATLARPNEARGWDPPRSNRAKASSSFPWRRRSSPRRTRPSPVMAGRLAASSSEAAVSSRSASSHSPRHMQTEAY